MSLQKNEGIQAVRKRTSRYLGRKFSAWVGGVLGSIIGFFGTPGKKAEDVQSDETEEFNELQEFPMRCIVFSDTDNDVHAVRNTLYFAGIINEKGEFIDSSEGVAIYHTGDYVDKKKPDLSIVRYWQRLQQDARNRGCNVKLIAGNHEQEIWRRIRAGEDYGMGVRQTRELSDFIESLDLFHVAGPVLFIHGYPTLEFLQTLLHFKQVTGRDLNSFNDDHYRRSFVSVSGMRQYAYVKESRRKNHLLYDVADADRYYQKRGQLVGAILEDLAIDVVVHGHKPQRSGVQKDYECAEWMPNIRMIGNDTNVSRKGIGATVIRVTSRGAVDMEFINTRTESDELRTKVRGILGERFESDAEELNVDAH
jgi:hypothetical protein